VGPVALIFNQMASSLLFGFAANTDNLTIGVAYGIRRRWIRWQSNLFIGVATTLVTLVALALGRQIRDMLPSRTPDILGGTLLMVFAAWNVYRDRIDGSDQPAVPASRFATRKTVGIGETFFLSGTLSINNVGLAIAGGVGGVGYLSAALSIFCFSLALLAFGQIAGGNFTRLKLASRVLCYPMSGNAVLALAGLLMLVGY
jgi:putative Mn2+ efflux pump MntP